MVRVGVHRLHIPTDPASDPSTSWPKTPDFHEILSLNDAVAESDILRTYTKSEAAALAAQWLDVFGKRRRGMNTKDFLWHVFSGARYPSVSGAAALVEYDKQVVHEYIVLSNQRDVAFVVSERPADKLMWDYLVFPANFAWTMAFTHEDGWLGPYFARHPDYARLTAANLTRVEKEREAAVARSKGWA